MQRKFNYIFTIPLIFLFYSQALAQSNSSKVNKRVAERISYINQYKDIAIRHMNKYGIPASIILAQACLESGNGKSTLAIKGKNHFGIKCHNNWKGDKIFHNDDAPNECFRKYKLDEDSFVDHANHLKTQRRYAFLFDLDIRDYKKWANGLKAAGYATNPNYAKELINIIEDYQLYKYDTGENTKETSIEQLTKENITNAELDIEFEGVAKGAIPLENSPFYAINSTRQLYIENGRAYLFANEGDSYTSIAREYNLFNREIRKYNGAKKRDKIRPGQKIYLEK